MRPQLIGSCTCVFYWHQDRWTWTAIKSEFSRNVAWLHWHHSGEATTTKQM